MLISISVRACVLRVCMHPRVCFLQFENRSSMRMHACVWLYQLAFVFYSFHLFNNVFSLIRCMFSSSNVDLNFNGLTQESSIRQKSMLVHRLSNK